MPATTDSKARWFAVRCFIAVTHPSYAQSRLYEERVTLWWARGVEEAIARAEAEAREYAQIIEDTPDAYLGLAQGYDLGETAVGNGTEVFSLIRESSLEPTEYLDTFFDTGAEFQGDL